MGMDVYGINPTNEQCTYFRSNVWYWHPLWDCLEQCYPHICTKVQNAHDNSGDGLCAEDAFELSKKLKIDLENGNIQSYITKYQSDIESLPLEDCQYCERLGVRSWDQLDGTVLVKKCNVCSGTLKVKSFMTHYHMDIDLMKEFQVFLENCGGFQIC